MKVHVREARLPADKPDILGFIVGLQQYEHALETNRRLDAQFAEEHYANLIPELLAHRGKIFIAEDPETRAVGWVAVCEKEGEIYIRAEDRRYGFIAELYVVEAARGAGVGRLLIAACEDWARQLGLTTVRIGVLAGNSRAIGAYERSGYGPYSLEVRKRL
ncbi:MAG: GNAT family N-acetyltransferase [Alphaproteobacteria bacterium]|nr:GNAT family N-acetyltransferase [Alphaproteobacteria bacterium]MDE2164057.1 GNAT family N-acetyltransferase [Alphaproteobacteria bacterium]MDE2266843.1 GNAT family N-acetyltransferase [Alphaproteobacteria bacterium]MDE2500110.1 GNAT family N-acetyltransferase [Alphaproteobacteria bacterium]